MSTLRRSGCIRWLPPIESASPSPVTTQTDRSRRDVASPVEIAGARPWVEWIPEAAAEYRQRRAPLDGAHPEGLAVVREARRAADPGDEDEVLARDAELRQERLDASQDRV